MPEKTTDDEPTDESANSERSVIDEIRRRRADDEDENEDSGSRVRTLLFLGFAFIAGYLVGKSQNESDFREEFGEFSGTDGGPMEIEIHDTDSVTKSDDDEAVEGESEDEATEADDEAEEGDEEEGDEEADDEEEEE